jgi:hypothetical protein
MAWQANAKAASPESGGVTDVDAIRTNGGVGTRFAAGAARVAARGAAFTSLIDHFTISDHHPTVFNDDLRRVGRSRLDDFCFLEQA